MFILGGCTSKAMGPPASSVGTLNDHVASDPAPSEADQELRELWQRRLNDSFAPVFAIGPGDLIDISVPEVDEIKERTERVSPEGAIALPVIGSVHVGGLTEEEINALIKSKLARYVKEPEVDIFVRQFSSRQVAVTGMVSRPGLYTLNSRNDTVLDMIGRAGGMSENAGSSIVLSPSAQAQTQALPKQMMAAETPAKPAKPAPSNDGRAQPAAWQQPERAGAEQGQPAAAAGLSAPASLAAGLAKGSKPIFIKLVSGSESNLSLPVRPGDIIIVAARGQVLVQGWVQNPGSYAISPGMTAFGAITAAGGQLFSSSAKVLRAGPHGEKIELRVDLSKVEHGQEPDIAVESGDVVIVERSVLGAVPFGLYSLLSRFGTGLAFPIP